MEQCRLMAGILYLGRENSSHLLSGNSGENYYHPISIGQDRKNRLSSTVAVVLFRLNQSMLATFGNLSQPHYEENLYWSSSR